MLLRVVLIVLSPIAFSSLASPAVNCVLVEGAGADSVRIGATRDKVGPVPEGLSLQYKGDVLVQIFVAGGECRTAKGIKLGDSQKDIEHLYGRGKKTAAYLTKGRSDSQGRIGDFILDYPGVAFVISKGSVAAIFIKAADERSFR